MNMKVHLPNGFAVPPLRLVITALILVVLAVATVFVWQATKPSSPDVPAPDYWPTNGWRSSTPEAQGISSDKLAELLLAIREKNIQVHSLLVIRNGYVVANATFYPYDGQTVHNVASVTKSMMTTLIGIAADQGKLDLDDKMISFFPDRPTANLDQRKQNITVRHLASMSSGLDCTAEADELTLQEMLASDDWVQFVLDRKVAWKPGEHFVYCSPAIHLLSPILQQATGMTALDFARQYLFEPLGLGEVMWPRDPQGYYDGWADISLHPHDMAKLGFLFLHKGQWEGQQIVSRHWVEEATQVQVATPAEDVDPYGYGWWMVPDIEGVYRADGRGGQYIFVLPQWAMIVVTTGGGFEMDEIGEQLLASFSDFEEPLPANPAGVARLEAAVGESDSLPANPEGVAELQAALAEVAQPPEAQPVPPLPEMARAISGHTYVFEDNPYRLASIRLDFGEATLGVEKPAEVMVDFTFYDDTGDRLGVAGLDGQYRFAEVSDGPARRFILGLRGAWTDTQTFVLDYNEIASPNALMLSLHFDGERVTLDGLASDVMGAVSIEGWQE